MIYFLKCELLKVTCVRNVVFIRHYSTDYSREYLIAVTLTCDSRWQILYKMQLLGHFQRK